MSWLVWIQQPLSVGVIAHPHTHALGDSTPPAPRNKISGATDRLDRDRGG
ncbi:MAG: hypothetical protein ACRCY0_10705 [Synechococcus elongatus]